MDLRNGTKLSAFTLAEVLITVTIIGVVAAITMPTLFYKQADEQFIGMMKKYEAIMQRVFDETSVNGTPVSMWGWNGEDDSAAADAIMRDFISQKLQIVKYCGTKSGDGCGSEYLGLDGTSKGNWDSDSVLAKSALVDGITMGLKTKSACPEDVDSQVLCGEVIADLNGRKGPNRIGRDIFYFGIYSNGLFMPLDYDKTKEEINDGCKKGADGKTCAAKVMIDDWKFKKSGADKYPW